MRELLGLVLLLVQAALLVPLIAHARRVRSSEGVALSGEAIWSVAGVGWLVWAAWSGDPIVVVSGALAAAGSGVLTALLWPHAAGAQRRTALVFAAATCIGLMGSAAAGVNGLALGLAVFGVVQFVPQAWTSARALILGLATPGTSVNGAYLRAVYTGGWAVYAGAWALWGLTADDIAWPLLAWGLMGVLAFGTQAAAARKSATSEPATTTSSPLDA